jgi:hypothetical protein
VPIEQALPLEEDVELRQTIAEDAEEVIPFKYSITSYGADFPVDGLVKRLANGSIVIPSFQRAYVWSLRDASRFVESLLLGLPVPSIFLSREAGSQQMLVIDGQQRLQTLRYFYDGLWPTTHKEFGLKGVQVKFEGATYKGLADEDRRRLDDSIIHAIIVKQDEPSDDESSIYYIFERLNTSGVSLTAQEIRTVLFHGPLGELLRELNEFGPWRNIYGAVNKFMRDQELILRFLALYFDSANYSRPMKEFLNQYMGKNRNLRFQDGTTIRSVFTKTVTVAHEALGDRAFKPARAINAAVFDAVMVGMARRLESGPINDVKDLKARYGELLKNNDFLAVSERATADEESVSRRLYLATNAFATVK